MVCEPCNSKLLGGFDPDKKEVQLYSVRLFYLFNYAYFINFKLAFTVQPCN